MHTSLQERRGAVEAKRANMKQKKESVQHVDAHMQAKSARNMQPSQREKGHRKGTMCAQTGRFMLSEEEEDVKKTEVVFEFSEDDGETTEGTMASALSDDDVSLYSDALSRKASFVSTAAASSTVMTSSLLSKLSKAVGSLSTSSSA